MTEEIWKPVKGYEKHYLVSNLGRLKRHNQRLNKDNHAVIDEHIMTPAGNNYLLSFNGKQISQRIANLVAEAYITKDKNKLKTHVIHKDGDHSNNLASNLEWSVTPEYTRPRGNVISVDKDELQSLVTKYQGDLPQIAAILGVPEGTVIKRCHEYNIKFRKRDLGSDKRYKHKIPEKSDLVHYMKKYQGDTLEVGKHYGVSLSLVKNWCDKLEIPKVRKAWGYMGKQKYPGYKWHPTSKKIPVPSKEKLLVLLNRPELSFEDIAGKLNVSSTTLRKWVSSYDLPTSRSDYFNH